MAQTLRLVQIMAAWELGLSQLFYFSAYYSIQISQNILLLFLGIGSLFSVILIKIQESSTIILQYKPGLYIVLKIVTERKSLEERKKRFSSCQLDWNKTTDLIN